MSANDELQAHTCEKMSEFYGDVANNVAQGKVQDLTEKWKKGELESGWYYVKGADGLFGTMSDYALYRVNLEYPDNEITLLAKMPSYEEWKRTCDEYRDMQEQVFSQDSIYSENERLVDELEKLEQENQHLKELLSECVDYIGNTPVRKKSLRMNKAIELLAKISMAIGEK